MNALVESVVANLAAVRRTRPLVFSMTNFVVMNETANAILAVGGSPVMSDAIDEVAELASISGALVLNIGTLYPSSVDAMVVAGRAANAAGVPVIFDPVGAGATRLRTDAARRILADVRVSVMRANQGEAMAVAGMDGRVRGVDSASEITDFARVAGEIARKIGCPVAVTGKTDVVTDGDATYLCHNGHPMLQTVTGTGCTVTALTGCFAAACNDVLLASVSALAVFGLCGELAAAESSGPGSFEVALRDRLFTVGPVELAAGARVARI